MPVDLQFAGRNTCITTLNIAAFAAEAYNCKGFLMITKKQMNHEKNLVEFFRESPLAKYKIDVTRTKDKDMKFAPSRSGFDETRHVRSRQDRTY